MSMGGFQPAELHVAAGQATTVRLVNLDGPYHTDGGGVHQFASPALGIDVKVPPRSSATLTIPASARGTYAFYCDVCCGGKENPSMQGTIVVS
jgi:plastocyanin